jgi:hypothetical protein
MVAVGDRVVMTIGSSEDRPQLAATFTELTPLASSLFAGKKIFVDGTIAGVPQIRSWRAQRRSVATIDELFAYVAAAQRQNCCAIRGLAAHQPDERVLRRKVKNEDDPTDRGFRDVPQPWAAFDFDDVVLAPSEDWADDPEGAVDSFVRIILGGDVSYVAAFTGTHGLLKTSKTQWSGAYDFSKLRIRIFLMLDRAIGCDELKAWTRIVGADESVARVVQPIYLARPQWLRRPGHDVLESIIGTRTCWLARREHDVMQVPANLDIEARWQAVERTGSLGASHPDVDAAILALGAEIYPNLQCAVQHLCRQNPLPDGVDPQAHAITVNNTLIARINAMADQVRSNLVRHKRTWDDLLARLQNDTPRWAQWLLEHPTAIGFAGERKPTMRVKIDAVPPPKTAEDALNKWRQRIIDAVRHDFVDRVERYHHHGKSSGEAPPVIVVRGPTGTGKSRASRAAALHLASNGFGNIVIALPRHELGEEQLQAFADEFPGQNIQAAIWRGYGADDPLVPGAQMCRRVNDISAVLRACVKASSLCKQGKGTATGYCPFFHHCGYQRQKHQQARIWFVAHETLVHERPKAIGDVGAIVIDESFIDAFLFGVERPIEFPVASVAGEVPQEYRYDLDTGRAALKRILDQLPDGPVPRSALAPVFSKSRCNDLYRLEWEQSEQPLLLMPTASSAAVQTEMAKIEARNVAAKNLAMMWRAIGEIIGGSHEWSGRLKLHRSTTGQRLIQRCGVHDLPEGWCKAPILITDSTSELELIRAIWPQATENSCNDPLPMLHTKLEQVVNRKFAKTRCAPTDDKADPADDGDDSKRARMARSLYAAVLAEGLKFAGKPVGLITHKATEAWIRANCPVPPWLKIAHFGETNGRNDFQEVACLIIAGRSLPPAEAVTRTAEALFGEAIEHRDYVTHDVQILTAPDRHGNNAVMREQFWHPDARTEAVRRMACEGGLLQAIGRARAAQRTADTPLVIKLWTDVGLGAWIGPVNGLLWDQVRPTIDELMLGVRGLALENASHAADAVPEIAVNAAMVRKARQREAALAFAASARECDISL